MSVAKSESDMIKSCSFLVDEHAPETVFTPEDFSE